MKYILAHICQYLLRPNEGVRITPTHKRQGSGGGGSDVIFLEDGFETAVIDGGDEGEFGWDIVSSTMSGDVVVQADGQIIIRTASGGVARVVDVEEISMRGGSFDRAYDIPREDLQAYLGDQDRAVLARHRAWAAALPDGLTLPGLLAAADAAGDVVVYSTLLGGSLTRFKQLLPLRMLKGPAVVGGATTARRHGLRRG